MSHYNFQVKLPLGTPVIDQFLGLKPPTKCQATYVWIDGTGENLRSKTRTLDTVPEAISEYPIWNYDGSSTGQATGRDSDMYLYPVAVYEDPFSGPNARLVLCDTYNHLREPTATNHRAKCLKAMKMCANERPWFGIEQEYLLLDRDGYPLGWPKHGYPAKQGPYYCAIGADRIFGREIVETHYRACLNIGINIGGTNAEVTPGQWEYQIGVCEGIDMGDQMWISRYILHRVCEQFGVIATFDPKPSMTSEGWNGAGCHTNFSTEKMRAPGGLEIIKAAMPKLESHHSEHLKIYDPNGGEDNLKRLSGKFETSSVDKFTWGIGNRGCSVRIPRQVAEEGKGYLEDRRPSSNVDPYQVTAALVNAILLS